jgi:hypothetical protein
VYCIAADDTGKDEMRFQVLIGMVAFVLMSFVWTTAMFAGEVPYAALVRDQDGCKETFNGPSNIKAPYCLCVAIDFHNELSMKEYLALTAEVVSKTDDSGSISVQKALTIKRIRDISSACLKRISDQM